jgi:hypothetical protein
MINIPEILSRNYATKLASLRISLSEADTVVGRTGEPGTPDGTAVNEILVEAGPDYEVWVVITPTPIICILLGGPKI